MGTSRTRARRLHATCSALALGAVLALPAGAWGSTPEPDSCAPLVTHTPQGGTGDREAVAITSQSLEQGRQGWVHVAWEAAEGTTVDEVHVVRDAGTEHLRDGDLRTGTAEDVLELRFCGRVADDAGTDPDGPDGPDGPDDGPDGDQGAGGDEPAEVPDDGGGASGEPAGDDADHEPHAPTGQAGASDGDDDVEVLGRQLTAEDHEDDETEVLGTSLARTGVEIPVLVAAGTASALIGLLAVLWTRARARRAD